MKIIFFLFFIPAIFYGEVQAANLITYYPALTPTITGPDTTCSGEGGYVYITEPGMTNYVWTISPSSGGTITSGYGTNSITVTWNSPGSYTVSVTYDNASVPAVMYVTVLPALPAGITISSSGNPVCAGTLVTFTATLTNGGSSPYYQWMMGGMNVGTNNPTFTYTPANGDTVSCLFTSNLPCSTGNPASSNLIIMTVNPNLPVSISISASANPVCNGTLVTFTASPVNGGTSPGYQWKVNGVNAGTNSGTFSYIPVNGDVITCELTSNAPCSSGNPAISNPVTITVSPDQQVSVFIAASANPACLGSPVTLTATPANGGSSPVYEWKINGIVYSLTSGPTLTYTPVNGDIIICNLTSNAPCATGNPATSNTIVLIVNTYAPVSISISASSNPVCAGIPVIFTATHTNGGSTPAYQWKVGSADVGSNSPVFTYNPGNGDTITCELTSNVACPIGNPATSNSIIMTVSPNLPASVSIIASANPACQGTPVLFTATPVNGGTSPFFQWKVNGVNVGTNNPTYTYTPNNGDIVTCQMISNDPCNIGIPVMSNTINMIVSPGLAVGVSITASVNPVCQGNTVTFTATPTNGGSSPVYEWKVDGVIVGTNSSSYSYIPTNGQIVTCKLTSSLSCATGNPATSNAITMIVSSNLPVSITITASPNPSCADQIVTYTATAINGGTNPTYQWMVNGINLGSDNPVFTYTPVNGDCIICHLLSSYSCASGNPAVSNQICMTVNPNLPVSVSILSSQNPSCQGTSITYTATPVNQGSSPVFQWKVNNVNAGSNQSTFTFVPATGNVITCQLTSSIPCPVTNPVTSNAITQIVNPIVPTGITITSSATPPVVCTGTAVTFTASIINGGSTPFYQWKINGLNVGSNGPVLIYIPLNGDVITCTLTSSLMCVSGNPITSNSITMVVSSSLPASVSIFASANPFCQGTSVTFTAFPANGGTSPTYQWQVNGITVGNQNTFNYSPLNGDYITCRMTSSLFCATPNPVISSPIILSVNTNTPVSVSIVASENPVCQGSPVTFTATPDNGGTSPSYHWKVNGIDNGTNSPVFTYNPLNGDIVTCVLTSNAFCAYGSPAISNPITMVVSTALPASIFIKASSNPFCQGSSVTFTAFITNGGSSPVYLWKKNGIPAGTNSPTFSCSPANGDIITCQLTSNATCISGTNPVLSNPITMAASTALPVSIAIAASANPVCEGISVTFTATPTNGGSTPLYQWKVNGNDAGTNSQTYTYPPLNGDIVTCRLTSSLSCATGNPATSNAITLTITPPLPVSVSIVASNNPVCLGVTETFTATPTNGGSDPVYKWRRNGILVDSLHNSTYSCVPLNGDLFTCELISNATCISGNPAISNQILIVVYTEQPVSVIITASSNPFCAGSTVIFRAHPTNGGTAPIFYWRVNGVHVGGNDSVYVYQPLSGDTITCQLTSNQGCICNNPAMSNAIIMVASSDLPVSVSISISSGGNPICAGTLVTFTATPTNGGPLPSYQWKVNGINAGPNSNSYSYYPADGDIVTCSLTSSLTCATGNPATSNGITMTVYPSAPVSITIDASSNPCCTGSSVTFTATPTNGGSNPVYQWYDNGFGVGVNSPTYTCIPINGHIFTCRLFSNATCRTGNPAYSNAITMIVNPYLSVGVSIIASVNPVCQGTAVTFTATPVNGGPSPAYQWKVNGVINGTNSPTFSYTPVNSDVVSCVMTSNEPCVLVNTATSNSILMTVSPYTPVSVLIAASINPACQGSPVTFNATPANGGTAPSYQWKVRGINAGTNNQMFTYIPINDDTVTCILTSNTSCPTGNPATSNAIIMNVGNSFPVSVSITASSNPVCQGQTITYTAIPVNGGVNPYYQWLVKSVPVGPHSPVFSYIPTTGDTVSCQLTSDLTCTTGNPAMSNSIVIIFFPDVSVSVSITCSANPTCQGNPVTYTAISVNGGSAPVYKWKVNGICVDSLHSSYPYVPQNGDVITCQLTSNVPCPINNPVTSNTITMMVQTPVPSGISITASANPVCVGTTVTYTAIPVNGGSSPTYHWYVNGSGTGANASTLNYAPANGDITTCQLISSLSCVSGNPSMSNPISMGVNTEFPVSVNITPSSNPVCQGQSVTFTANPVNGGTSPFYRWKVNGIPVGTNNPFYNYIPTNGDCITCTLTSSYSCGTGNPAVSNQICMTVNPYLPVSVSITCSLNPVCVGTPVTFTATPGNGGSAPAYQWKVNGINAGPNSNIYTYIPVNGDVVSCLLTSNLACAGGNPALSNLIIMTIGSAFPVSVSIVASANPICEGTPVTFTATATYGGTLPVYQWKVNGINAGTNSPIFSYSPILQGDIIICVLTSNLPCGTGNPATSNAITMTVLSVPVSVTIIANPTGPVCSGDWVTFTAAPVNGGANPTYMWRINGFPAGTNSSTFSYQPADGDTVKCVLTSNATCASGNTATSNLITMTVNLFQPVSVSIVPSATTVCAGSLVTITATPVNGGSSPSYQWKVNGINNGTNSPVFSYTPVNSDVITCVLTSNTGCPSGNPATSNAITMTVNPNLPVFVSIAVNQNNICEGTTVTYTTTPSNEGSNPSYQWKVNSGNVGTNSPNYSYIPLDGDIITCVLTSTVTCPTGNPATSNAIIMTVNPLFPVSITVTAAPSDTVCEGTLVCFTAIPVNGGPNPVYQWKHNGVNAGANNPVYCCTPMNGDIITCVLTSNITCPVNNPATSNSLVMSVFANPYVLLNMCLRLTSRDGKPIVLRGGIPAGGIYSGQGVSNGLFYPNLIPVNQDSAMITYTNTSAIGCISSGNQYIVVKPSQPFTCGNNYTDIRDNKSYPTVFLGSQCWFAKNLDYGQFITASQVQYDNCTMEKYCYYDNLLNCDTFGGLYQWDEMMQYDNLETAQGFCPPGWHIPCENEWNLLFGFFNSNAHAGDSLKMGVGSGFHALLSGERFNNRNWNFKGFSGFFWSSTPDGALKGWAHGINAINHGVSSYPSYRSNAFSIRCIKD